MLKPQTKRNLSKIIPFGIIWFGFGLIFFLVEWAARDGLLGQSVKGVAIDFRVFVFGILANTAVGLIIGMIEVFFFHHFFADKSFSQKVLYKTVFYSLILFLLIGFAFSIAVSLEIESSILNPEVWDRLILFLGSMSYLSTQIQLSVQLAISVFYAEISENIGRGIMINFFTGKYHQARKEQRIFMFLDMKSSTTIAEELGHQQYFEFLKAYYNDLSNAIIQHFGEIYQYVGDEVIVSWKYENGLRNNNCLNCFFAMKEELKKRSDWYGQHFGLSPTFKAGFHLGEVTTGEIGALKKEIIFTGDVLNSTARIQALCNQFKVDILISEDLLNNLDSTEKLIVKPLGSHQLKGKNKSIPLFTLEEKSPK